MVDMNKLQHLNTMRLHAVSILGSFETDHDLQFSNCDQSNVNIVIHALRSVAEY